MSLGLRRRRRSIGSSEDLAAVIREVMTELMAGGEPTLLDDLSRRELLLVVGGMTAMFDGLIGSMAGMMGQTRDQAWQAICAAMAAMTDAEMGGQK